MTRILDSLTGKRREQDKRSSTESLALQLEVQFPR
jgi:hypothetical protein